MLLPLLLAAAPIQAVAPVPLYRDPVHDGAADPSIVRDARTGEWTMFYTNRRADLTPEDAKDVRWVHGTALGVARSRDGATWRYAGTAAIPVACTGATLWAPNVQRFGDTYHMWVTVVPGVFRDWDAPRFIQHLTSRDLTRWACADRLDLGADRVIDASVIALPQGGYRLFFNDERMGKAIRTADCSDLIHWRVGNRLTETPDDGERWVRQPGYLLADAGTRPTDRAKGQHPDVVVAGNRAYIVYFVHQGGEDGARTDPHWHQRSVLQIAELTERDGVLGANRNVPTRVEWK